ncbi:hypothetical protein AB205_0155330 [Aquarana catesbeiana]|uniref:Protein kinase domain-containing protein n=1 Tax=Aquarana catesbeiana TaxID=8400 RepID=A0A2G9QGP7_AQUCT|nr:hypothetical protein AB205_0155330 [Aquarana catesbeiana]
MTRDAESRDELPDWAGAKEFYQKYDPKEIIGRGVSSTVRRCIHRETGREYAAKIIEVTPERLSPEQLQEVRLSTAKEMEILHQVSHHPSIISLIDSYESSTFIFLVFDLMKRGELFDYLTEKVKLSEKETRCNVYTITRLLEVAPEKRLSADQALQHPFFQSHQREQGSTFTLHYRFRRAAWAALACVRILMRWRRARPVTSELLALDPYGIKGVRRLIDACAFRIYGHWVKKGERQNRAALFQNQPKALLLTLGEDEDQDGDL